LRTFDPDVLSNLPGRASDRDTIRHDLAASIDALVAELAHPDGVIPDPSAVFGLLGVLDGEISELLDTQPDSSRAGWLAKAGAVLGAVGRMVAAVGTALLVSGASLASAGRVPGAADEIQAAAALVIGAACGLVQRDLAALWRQPDLARHLTAADTRLRCGIADLHAALNAAGGRDTPPAEGVVRSCVLQVEYAAYAAASVVAATADWLQASPYLDQISGILDLCKQVSGRQLSSRTRRGLPGAVDDIQYTLSQLVVPPKCACVRRRS
jgi:hypothetical protein